MASSRRQKRLSELLKEELGKLFLNEVQDPRLAGVIVTGVEMSPDLGHARVYVSLIGDQQEKDGALAALERASGFLRHQIAERLSLRRVPAFSFYFDESIERGQRILDILHHIEEDSEEKES